MQRHDYIGEFEIVDDHRSGKIVVQLKGRINKCGVVSPRFDLAVRDIEKQVNNLLPSRQFGHILLTTSSGIMDHEEARRKHTGGKILGVRAWGRAPRAVAPCTFQPPKLTHTPRTPPPFFPARSSSIERQRLLVQRARAGGGCSQWGLEQEPNPPICFVVVASPNAPFRLACALLCTRRTLF